MLFRVAGGVRLAAVGTWTHKLLLLSLPSMKVTAEEAFETQDLPRSMLFMAVGGRNVLLLGMGDGHVAHWQVCNVLLVRNRKTNVVHSCLNPETIVLNKFRTAMIVDFRTSVYCTTSGFCLLDGLEAAAYLQVFTELTGKTWNCCMPQFPECSER